MNDNEIEQQLRDQSQFNVPKVAPPPLGVLNARVDVARRRRRRFRTGVSGAVLLVVAGGTLAWINGTNTPRTNGGTESTQIVDAMPKNPTSPKIGPTDTIATNTTSKKKNDSTFKRPRIQLYAKVRQPLPVFDIQQDTKAIHHIGWVECEESIPLDMRYVPDSQQQTFDAVLNGRGWTVDL